jgi:nucleoid DNA-binding protein
MVEGYKIECRGFGHLERRKRPPRCIHHPQKQNVFLEYPGRYAAYFRPGKALREALQKAAAANIPIQVEQEEDFFQLDDENN